MTHGDIERLAVDAIKQTILSSKSEIEPDILGAAIERQRARSDVTEKHQGRETPEPPVRSKAKRSK
jgi:hypothetical protein